MMDGLLPCNPNYLLMAIHEDFRKHLLKYWLKGLFTDLEIKSVDADGKHTFHKVHKIIMCSASQYFQQMLEADLELELSVPTTTVTVTGISCKILHTLLEFIYSGDLQLSGLTYKELKELPLMAKNLGIFSVGNAYITGLCNSMNSESLPVMIQLQSRLKSKDLEQAICDCVIDNFPDFPGHINDLLTRNQLHNVLSRATQLGISPDVLLQTTIAWVNHNPSLRQKDMQGLLARIQFESLPYDFISYLTEDDVMMKKYPSLMQRLTDLMPPRRYYSSPVTVLLKYRGCKSDSALVVAKHSCVSPRKRVSKSRSDGTASTYSQRCSSPIRRMMLPVPSVQRPSRFKDVGYAVIGRDESNRASVMFCKLVGNVWSAIEDLGMSLDCKQAVAYCNDCLYFIGGEDMHGAKLDRCYMYDLGTSYTRRLPDLRIKRLMPVIAIHHQVIHVAGGLGRFDDNWLSHMEILDGPYARTWQNAAPLRERRNGEASCCIFEDRIYVVGGGTNKCECYDAKRQGWQLVAPLPDEFSDLVILTSVTMHRLYAFHYFRPVIVYWLDTEEQVWREVHTKGNGPEWILFAVGVANKIITLDKSRYIFVYEAMSNYWHRVRKLPRVMMHPVAMAPVNPLLVD